MEKQFSFYERESSSTELCCKCDKPVFRQILECLCSIWHFECYKGSDYNCDKCSSELILSSERLSSTKNKANLAKYRIKLLSSNKSDCSLKLSGSDYTVDSPLDYSKLQGS